MHGVVLSLASGTATDPWGGTETLSGIENAWGSQLADDLTGLALAGTRSFLRGLAGVVRPDIETAGCGVQAAKGRLSAGH